MTVAIQALHEPYAYLYVGDCFADTLDLSALEHCALRLLLLETWVRGPVGNARLARVAGLTKEVWQAIKPAVLPLLLAVQPTYGPSMGNGFRQPTGTSSAASSWSAIDMLAPIAAQTSSPKPIISFRSAVAVSMPSSISRLPADPAICRKARRRWRTGAHRDSPVFTRQASGQSPNLPRHPRVAYTV